jgi:hypothetical protein
MTAKCEAKNEATVSGGSPRIRRSRPGTNMRVLFAVVDKNRTPAEKRARIFYEFFKLKIEFRDPNLFSINQPTVHSTIIMI